MDRQSPDQPGRVSFWLDYASVGHFEPSLGFFPENNFNALGGGLDYDNRSDKGALANYSAWLNVSRRTWRSGPDAGRLLDRGISPGVYMAWRKGWDMSLGADFYERPPFKDRTQNVSLGWNIADLYRKGGLSMNFGRRAGADYRFTSLSQGFRLNPRLSARAAYERLEMGYPDRTESGSRWAVSGISESTPERSLVLRWLFGSAPQPARPEVRETFDNCYLGYRQSVRRGLDIYLLLGDTNAHKMRSRGMLKLIQVL